MKKLISFLGTTEYQSCRYTYNGFESTESRFTQTAVYELLCRDFIEQDEVIVFLTEEAESKNWFDSAGRTGQHLEGLDTAWKRIVSGGPAIKTIKINDNQDESHLWELFDKILGVLDEDDEVIFDITHGFRSLPIMASVVLNYARFLKNVVLKNIVYGCYEERIVKIRHGDPGSEYVVAPIIDLTPMVRLMDWTNGVDHFLRSGNAALIQELTKSQVGALYKNSLARDATGLSELTKLTSRHRIVAKELDAFTKSMLTCRGPNLQEQISKLRARLQEVEEVESEHFEPLAALFDSIHERISGFSSDPVMIGHDAARWCYEHGLIQQGVTFLLEGLITAICIAFDGDVTDSSYRKLVSNCLNIVEREIPDHKWKVSEQDKPRLAKLVSQVSPLAEYLTGLSSLIQLRNDINHAGFKNKPHPHNTFAARLRTMLGKSHPLFEQLQRIANERQEGDAGVG